MIFLTTLEAKRGSAFALNDVFGCVGVSFNEQVAILGRAPLYVSVIISELLAVPLQILLLVVHICSLTGGLGQTHH